MSVENLMRVPLVDVAHTIRSMCEACLRPVRSWRGICDDCIAVAKRAAQTRYDPALDPADKVGCKAR